LELNQDWRTWQATVFPESFPARSFADASGEGSARTAGALYCVQEQGYVLALFAEGERLLEWTGASIHEVRAQFQGRVIFEWQTKDLEAKLLESLAEPHLLAQIEAWRETPRSESEALQSIPSRRRLWAPVSSEPEAILAPRKQFLFETLAQAWWSRVLPSSFGIFFRWEDQKAVAVLGSSASLAPRAGVRDYLVVYRKGKLEQFGVPDLSFLGVDRRKDPSEVVKYLADRCLVPVQGVLLNEEDWARWSEQKNPWREIAWAVQSSRVQLVPFRWGIVSLIALRGLLGI
jgi:hypothetical protein